MAARRPAARSSALLGREPAEGVRRVALDLLAEAAAAAVRLPDPGDVEALHDFRVAARRLRSWLRSFTPLVKGTLRKRWRRALRDVAGATGAARDAEVMQSWVQAERAGLPARHRHAADRFLARLAPGAADPRAEAAAEFARLAPHLEEALSRYEGRVGGVGPRERFGGAWAAALEEQLEALGAALAESFGPDDVEPAHRARIEGKRLRYLLEPLRGLLASASPAVATLKELQDLLGELHDVHVLGARLADSRAEADAESARAERRTLRAEGEERARSVARRSAAPGLAALERRARERRDALHAALARHWMGGGPRTRELRRDVERVIAALARPRRPAQRRKRRVRAR